jgi:hypothetical protein
MKRIIFYAKLFYRFAGFRQCGARHVANRSEFTTEIGNVEATLILRATNQPNAYSREELYSMLQTIRQQEEIQGWQVPEQHPKEEGGR